MAEDFESEDMEMKEYDFKPETIILSGRPVFDYSGAERNKIYLANKRDVLTKPRPSWIPELDMGFLEENDWLPPCAKDKETGLYYVYDRHSAANPNGLKLSDIERVYRMSEDVLAGTIDYYLKLARAKAIEEGRDGKITLLRRVRSMTWDRFDQIARLLPLCESYKDRPELLEYKKIGRKTNNPELTKVVFNECYAPALSAVRDKSLDMNLMKQDYIDTYTKGFATAYGESNCKDDLLEEFGVRIKKQNGTNFKPAQLDRMRDAVEKVWSHYGYLKGLAEKDFLKISYADDCKQFASQSHIGVFVLHQKAIGVSFFGEVKQKRVGESHTPDVTLAHETAHWIDCAKGAKLKSFFASDVDGTLERKIALLFKDELRREKTKSSIGSGGAKLGKYWFRTCECFARAMEQDYALSRGSDLSKEKPYVSREFFQNKLKPLIDQLREENEREFGAAKDVQREAPPNPLKKNLEEKTAAAEKLAKNHRPVVESVVKELTEKLGTEKAKRGLEYLNSYSSGYNYEGGRLGQTYSYMLENAAKAVERFGQVKNDLNEDIERSGARNLDEYIDRRQTLFDEKIAERKTAGVFGTNHAYWSEAFKDAIELRALKDIRDNGLQLSESEVLGKEEELKASAAKREEEMLRIDTINDYYEEESETNPNVDKEALAEIYDALKGGMDTSKFNQRDVHGMADFMGVELKENKMGKSKEETECLNLGFLFEQLEHDRDGYAETEFGFTLRREAAEDGEFYYDLLGGETGGLRLCCDGEQCTVLEKTDEWVKLIDVENIGNEDLKGYDTSFKLSLKEFEAAARKISLREDGVQKGAPSFGAEEPPAPDELLSIGENDLVAAFGNKGANREIAREISNKYNRLPQGGKNEGLFMAKDGRLVVRDFEKDANKFVSFEELAREARSALAARAAARVPAFEIVRNEEKGRVNIKFPADRKHPRFEEITKALKSHGWKFAPSTKMWYPLKVEGSEGFAKALLAEFSELKGSNVQEKVTEKVTENAGESDKGAYKDLISELREEYDKIYNMDSAEQAKILRERNARFNELSKNEEFNQLVAEIANERGDFISSDREVAALMVAMDKNGMLDKFSGKIESKIKDAPTPTDDKKQEEYKLNAFAKKTGINLNNHLVLENRKIVLERGSFALGGLTKKEFEDLKSKLNKANVSYKEEVRGETKVCLVDLSVLEDSETEKKDIIEEEKSRLNGTLKVYTRLSVEGREISFDPDFNTSFAARPYDEDGRRKFVILEEKRGEHASRITSVVHDLPSADWKEATLGALRMLAISEEGLKNGMGRKYCHYEFVPELVSRVELVDAKTGEDVKKDLLPEEVLEASDPKKAFLEEQEKKVNGFELLGLPYVKAEWSESGEVKEGTVWSFEEADKALAELNERLGPEGGYYKTELTVLYPTEGESEYSSYSFRFDLGSVESFGTLYDYIRETCSYPKEVFPGLEKAWKSVHAHSVEDNYVKSVDTIVKRTVDRMKPAFEEAKEGLSEALKAESKVMSSFLVEASVADAAESGVSAAKKKCAEEFNSILEQLAASTDPVLLGFGEKSLGYESYKAWSDFAAKNALTDLLCGEARLSPPADEFDWTAWRKMMDAIPSVSDFGKLLSAARQECRDVSLAATLGPKAENFSEALSAFAKRRPNLSPLEAGKILMKAVRPEELPKISDWLKGQGCVSEEATAKKFAEWISGKGIEKKTEIKESKKQAAAFDRELF